MSDRQRQNVMIMASLRSGCVEQRVRVADISSGGLKVKAASGARVDDRVMIALPALGWTAATVAWVRGETFGVMFDDPIDPAAARQAITGTYTRPAPPPPPQLRRVA